MRRAHEGRRRIRGTGSGTGLVTRRRPGSLAVSGSLFVGRNGVASATASERPHASRRSAVDRPASPRGHGPNCHGLRHELGGSTNAPVN